MGANTLLAYGASLIWIAFLVDMVQADGVSLVSSIPNSIRLCPSDNPPTYQRILTMQNIRNNISDGKDEEKETNKNVKNFTRENGRENKDASLSMYMDDEVVSERNITVNKDAVTVSCLKRRTDDGVYSKIRVFVNDEELGKEKLLVFTLSDAQEVTFKLRFDLQSNKPEDEKQVVKCIQKFNDEEEVITTTFVVEATEITAVEARALTTVYRSDELVEVVCVTDGSPAPPTDIAYYSEDCQNQEIPQPRLLVSASRCYITPPACVRCTVQQASKWRKGGEKRVQSDFLVMRMDSATSSALGRSGPGTLIFLLVVWVGIIQPIMNLIH